MQVVTIDQIPMLNIPGLKHQTLAGASNGLTQGEVWMQSVEPGGATPIHQHDCEEVIIALAGHGACVSGDKRVEFGPNSVLTIEANIPHQILNIGETTLTGYAFFTMGPVVIQATDGSHMPMPWDQLQAA